MLRNYFIGILLITLSSCSSAQSSSVLPGAYQVDEYLSLLKGKNIGVCSNHSGLIGGTHLIDSLLSLGLNVEKVYSPEHGFKGTAADGEKVSYENTDTPYELISLYGKNRKPTPEQLEGIDIVIFDIQDVGARFYTYLSTMTYIMEACARAQIPFMVLDRPNPNGSYVDGPVMEDAFKSFLGLHPMPIVHGLTPGEFAMMLNGEGWLTDGLQCDLSIIKIKNWTHGTPYSLPIKPSPNLPDDRSIAMYPSTCLFEQTIASEGRGTDYAFQQVGHPDYPDTSFYFIPKIRAGSSKPKFVNEKCFGISMKDGPITYKFSLTELITFYKKLNREDFFLPYFSRLAGTEELQAQIVAGWTEQDIRKSWEPALKEYKDKRSKYLIYD